MTDGSTVWLLRSMQGKIENAENKLAVVQDRCLRLVACDYKAALTGSLEAETQVLYIQLHLNQ